MSTGGPNSLAHQPFFLGAPTSKLFALGTLLSYLLIHAKNVQSLFAMDTNRILEAGEWHRLITAHMTFGSPGELVLGGMTVAHFSRRFERELGSRKFACWLLQVYLLSIPLIWTMASQTNDLHYAGPYPVLGGLLYLFYKYTPRLHPRFFGIFGFHVSEKAIPYCFALQVILFHGFNTVVPTMCGFVAGWFSILYTMNVPDFVVDFVSSFLGRLVEAPPAMIAPRGARTNNAAGREGGGYPTTTNNTRPRVAAATSAATTVTRAPQPPSQESIEQLTAMGFDHDTVVRALQQSNNNVERALDRLLSGGH